MYFYRIFFHYNFTFKFSWLSNIITYQPCYNVSANKSVFLGNSVIGTDHVTGLWTHDKESWKSWNTWSNICVYAHGVQNVYFRWPHNVHNYNITIQIKPFTLYTLVELTFSVCILGCVIKSQLGDHIVYLWYKNVIWLKMKCRIKDSYWFD